MDIATANRSSYSSIPVRPSKVDVSISEVPLLDIPREIAPISDVLEAAMRDVMRSGRFVLGPVCERFEEAFASYLGTRHAIGCASGSDALLLPLLALEIGAGDEVIVPSFTFFATASAVTRVGAVPVFVDIDPLTYTLDARAVEQAITPRTKAIIPVHLFGHPAEMTQLERIARKHALRIIEDCAQATGSSQLGRTVGTIGDVGCFSFYPTKNLGCFGDGGLITTSDPDLARRLKRLRTHGMEPRYVHHEVGLNSRLDAIQAAVLHAKLPYLPEWNMARGVHAERYASLIRQAGLDSVISLPRELPGHCHTWNQYTIRVPDGRRDELRAELTLRRIGTEIYYPIPLHRQKCFAQLPGSRVDLPVTEAATREVLSLPLFPRITIEEQEYVVRAIAEFFDP